MENTHDGAELSTEQQDASTVRAPTFTRRHTSPLHTINGDFYDTASLYIPAPQRNPAALDQLGMDPQGNPKPARPYPKKPRLDDDNHSMQSIESLEQHYNNEIKDYWDNVSIHSGRGPIGGAYGDTHDSGHHRERSRSRTRQLYRGADWGPPTAMDQRVMDSSTKGRSVHQNHMQNQNHCCRHRCTGSHNAYQPPSYPSYTQRVSRARAANHYRQPSCESAHSSYAYAGPRLYECHGCDGVAPSPVPAPLSTPGPAQMTMRAPAPVPTVVVPRAPAPATTPASPTPTPLPDPASFSSYAEGVAHLPPSASLREKWRFARELPKPKLRELMQIRKAEQVAKQKYEGVENAPRGVSDAVYPPPTVPTVPTVPRGVENVNRASPYPSATNRVIGPTLVSTPVAPSGLRSANAAAPVMNTGSTSVPRAAVSTPVVNMENHPGLRAAATEKKDDAKSTAGTTTKSRGLGGKVKGPVNKLKMKIGLFLAKHAH